ncbi:MAG: GDP-mannose 4,6-dehydratase [Amaricoccus sp.]
MRLLVTGGHGFAGSHVCASVARVCGAGTEIVLTSRQPRPGTAIEALDVLDPGALRSALREKRPTHVLNLAGIASPAQAAREPDLAWRVHLDGARNLATAILDELPSTVLVNAGTGLAYGASFRSERPVSEDAALEPLDEYGASKAAGDLALRAAAARGLKCLRLRPFNHSGPGQTEDFVIPAFAAQIARIEAGLAEPVLHVGNLGAARDFVDVRDVCDAYALALRNGNSVPPGTVLNIATGTARRIDSVLGALLAMSRARIRVEEDPARMRPSDVPVASGDPGRAAAVLGWEARIPFETTLRNVLAEWRRRVTAFR